MIPSFISQALAGWPLTIYGDGSQTGIVQYVDDLIEGVWLLMKSFESRPVNVGNSQEHTVREGLQRTLSWFAGQLADRQEAPSRR